MNLANAITLTRFIFIPLFFVAFFSGKEQANLLALLVLALSALSDVLDGYIARKTKQVTEQGKLLDPLADKLLMMAVILSFVIDRRLTWLEASLFFIRDIGMIIGSTFLYFRGKKEVPQANKFGKATTVMYYLVFLMILFELPFYHEALWLVIAFSFLTSLNYLFVYLKADPNAVTKRASR